MPSKAPSTRYDRKKLIKAYLKLKRKKQQQIADFSIRDAWPIIKRGLKNMRRSIEKNKLLRVSDKQRKFPVPENPHISERCTSVFNLFCLTG